MAQDLRQSLGAYPEAGSLNPNYCPGRARGKTNNQWQADKAVLACQPDFHAFALGQNGQYGSQSAIEKIAELDGFSWFMQHQVGLQLHES